MRRFGLSCIYPVYFLRKYTEFHDTYGRSVKELLFISFYLFLINLQRSLSAALFHIFPNIFSPIALPVDNKLMVYIYKR